MFNRAAVTLVNFNSIKVQLEPKAGLIGVIKPPIFQFHKGTIRTSDDETEFITDKKFQFHKGTIRTRRHNECRNYRPYFNSIKVRLERGGCQDHYFANVYFNSIKVRLELAEDYKLSSLLAAFQFHKGTIRTTENEEDEVRELHFNSIKVRLELNISNIRCTRYSISIP